MAQGSQLKAHLAIYQNPQRGDKPGYRLSSHFGVMVSRHVYLYSNKFSDKDTGLWIALTREQYDHIYPYIRLEVITTLRALAASFVSGQYKALPNTWANRIRKIAALLQGADREQADRFLGIAGMFDLREEEVIPGQVWEPDTSLVDTIKAALEW